MSDNPDRTNAFNPQAHAYNPTTAEAGTGMANRTQESRDARADAYNPQAHSYNPTSAVHPKDASGKSSK